MLSRSSYLSVGATAKSAEEVRERADAGEREGEIEPAVALYQQQRARNVEFLVLEDDAAALGAVEPGPALLDDVGAGDVPVEDVAAARPPIEQADRRRRVDGVVGIGRRAAAAPPGRDLHRTIVAAAVGAEAAQREVSLVELEPQRRVGQR